MDFTARVGRLQSALSDTDADALLVTGLTNVRYLTGFSGTNGQVLVWPDGVMFLSDPRYEARAAKLVEGADIVIYPVHLGDVLPDHLRRIGVRKLGVEAASLTIATRDDLASKLAEVELVATTSLVENLRRSKEDEEVRLIKQAVGLADDAFAWVLDRLAPGATEREVALDLEVRMRFSGADDVSFPPIVGSGPLSAHIHHTPSHRALEKGDLVLLDFGCIVDGYCSDLTRTVVLGAADDAQLETYATVLEAQQGGIEEVAAGTEAAYVDRVARRVISDAGHGERFGHGLGHGVGLDIHEAPTIKKTSDDVLAEGDVVTIEPGIYLPQRGGIRIEDCVLVEGDGAAVLSSAPKEELLQL